MIWDEKCPFTSHDEDEVSDLLDEFENYETLPILLKNNDNFEILSQELNKVENDLKKAKLRESEMKRNLENLTQMLQTKYKEIDEQEYSIEELKSLINEISSTNYESAIETEKKILNAYKRILRLKWLRPISENELEARYLQHHVFSKTDPCITEKVWTEISRAACDSNVEKLT